MTSKLLSIGRQALMKTITLNESILTHITIFQCLSFAGLVVKELTSGLEPEKVCEAIKLCESGK